MESPTLDALAAELGIDAAALRAALTELAAEPEEEAEVDTDALAAEALKR